MIWGRGKTIINNQKHQSNQNPLLSAPIPPLLRKIAIPVGTGAFFNTMFNVVDTYYGGLISNEALAALSLSFPIYFIIIALGFGLSSGNTALIGNVLGQGDEERAELYAVQGILYGIVLALLTSVAVIAIAPALYRTLGASGSYLEMGLSYINPIFYGTVFFVLQMMLNSPLNARGITTPFRNVLVAGFVLNLVLDPWFIFGGFGLPAMGITGIAIATVLVKILGCIYLAVYNVKVGTLSLQSFQTYSVPRLQAIRDISIQGFPNILDMSSVSIGFFILTYFVSGFGQEAVAAFGAASRIEQLAMLPLLGLEVATLSLIAQNNGAGLAARTHNIFNTAMHYGIIVMVIGATLITVLAPYLMGLFSETANVVTIGTTYIRIKAWALLPTAGVFIGFAAMRGVKRPIDALILSTMRMVILPLIFVYLFVTVMGFGLLSIWWVTFGAVTAVGIVAYFHAKQLLPTVN